MPYQALQWSGTQFIKAHGFCMFLLQDLNQMIDRYSEVAYFGLGYIQVYVFKFFCVYFLIFLGKVLHQ